MFSTIFVEFTMWELILGFDPRGGRGSEKWLSEDMTSPHEKNTIS